MTSRNKNAPLQNPIIVWDSWTPLWNIIYTQTEQYLEGFGSAATVESYTEADFVLLLQDLKSSLFPSGGAQVHAGDADLHRATAGEFGHDGCHGLLSSGCTFGGWGTCDQNKSYKKRGIK